MRRPARLRRAVSRSAFWLHQFVVDAAFRVKELFEADGSAPRKARVALDIEQLEKRWLPAVQFNLASSTYSVAESDRVVTVTVNVNRDGNTDTLYVNYETADGDAEAGKYDYTHANGTLTFNPGESSATFKIFITDDITAEDDETFSVTLKSPSTGTIGTGTAVLTVQKNSLPSWLLPDNATGRGDPWQGLRIDAAGPFKVDLQDGSLHGFITVDPGFAIKPLDGRSIDPGFSRGSLGDGRWIDPGMEINNIPQLVPPYRNPTYELMPASSFGTWRGWDAGNGLYPGVGFDISLFNPTWGFGKNAEGRNIDPGIYLPMPAPQPWDRGDPGFSRGLAPPGGWQSPLARAVPEIYWVSGGPGAGNVGGSPGWNGDPGFFRGGSGMWGGDPGIVPPSYWGGTNGRGNPMSPSGGLGPTDPGFWTGGSASNWSGIDAGMILPQFGFPGMGDAGFFRGMPTGISGLTPWQQYPLNGLGTQGGAWSGWGGGQGAVSSTYDFMRYPASAYATVPPPGGSTLQMPLFGGGFPGPTRLPSPYVPFGGGAGGQNPIQSGPWMVPPAGSWGVPSLPTPAPWANPSNPFTRDFPLQGLDRIDPGILIGLGYDPRAIDPGFSVGGPQGKSIDPGFFPVLTGPWTDLPAGLAFDSDSALNQPIISIKLPTDSTDKTTKFEYRLTVDGNDQGLFSVDNDDGHAAGETYVISDRVTTTVANPGVYTYVFDVFSKFDGKGDVWRQIIGTITLLPAPAPATPFYPFSPGWGWAGNDRIYVIPDKGIIYEYGQGGTRFFAESEPGKWQSPANDAGQLTLTGGKYIYTDRSGSQAEFELVEDEVEPWGLEDESWDFGIIKRRLDPSGVPLTYTYDTNGLASIVPPNGEVTSFEYDESGRVNWIRLPGNRTVTLEYDVTGRLTGIQLPDNNVTTFIYDANGNLTTYVEDKMEVVFDYEGGALDKIDRGFNRGAQPTITTDIDPRYTVDKTVPPRLLEDSNAKYFDALKNKTTFALDDEGRLVVVAGPDDSRVSFTYNAAGRMTGLTDPLNNITTFVYADNKVDLTKIWRADGTSYAYEYNGTHDVTNIKIPSGETATLLYVPGTHDVQAVTLPNKITTTFNWETGRLEGIETGNSIQLTTITYENGRVKSIQNPGNQPVTFAFDRTPSGGIVRAIEDALNRLTTTTYDPMGRLTGIHGAGGGEVTDSYITYTYNGNGWLASATDRLGNTTSFNYDEQGFLKSVKLGPEFTVYTFGYDKLGNVTRKETPWSGAYPFTATYDTTNPIQRMPWVVQNGSDAAVTYSADELFRLKSVENPNHEFTTFTYTERGLVASIKDAGNGVTTFVYDGLDNVIRITGPTGLVTSFAYNGNRPEYLVQPIGPGAVVTMTYLYDDLGRLRSVQPGPGFGVTSYAYDGSNRLTNLVYRWDTDKQRVFTFAYDGGGRLKSLEDPNWGTVSFAFDKLDRLEKLIEAYGQTSPLLQRTTTFEYDLQKLVSVTLPGGTTTSMAFDDLGRIKAVIRGFDSGDPRTTTITYGDPGFNIITFDFGGSNLYDVEFDARYLPNLIRDPLYRLTTFTRDDLGRVIGITDPRSTVTSFLYDPRGNVKEIVRNALGTPELTSFTYDGLNRLLSVRDATAVTTSFEYDGLGRPTVIVKGFGSTQPQPYTFTYDGSGGWVQLKDPLNQLTTLHFDSVGRPQKLVQPTLAVWTYTFDTSDRLVALVNPLNKATSFGYDSLDRLVWKQDALNNLTTFTYDPANHLLSIKTPDLVTTSYGYNFFGERTLLVEGFGSGSPRTTTTAFDGLGRVLSITDPLNVTTSYARDGVGRITAIIEALGVSGKERTTNYTYQLNGDWMSVADPNGNVTSIAYDALGRESVRIRAYGQTEAWTTTTTYLAGGLTGKISYPTGLVVSYSYDDLGQLTKAFEAPGLGSPSRTTSYGYNALGQLLWFQSPGMGVTSYGYDGAGRVTTLIEAFGATEARTSTTTYDLAGHVLSITAPDNVTTSYGLDALGQATLTLEAYGKGLQRATTTTYDAMGRVLSVQLPTTVVTSYGYDTFGRLELLVEDHGGGSKRTTTYSYDANDNLLSVVPPSKISVSYSYDALNQLTKLVEDATGLQRTTTWAYDLGGRVLSTTGPTGAVTSYAYDHLDRVVNIVEAWSLSGLERTTTYLYDPIGLWSSVERPLSAGKSVITSYAYDVLGRTTSVVEDFGGSLARETGYAYDAADRVLTVTDDLGTQTSFTYDLLGRMTKQVGDATGSLTRTTSFTYDALDRLLTLTDPMGAVTSYAYDELGRTSKITEAVSKSYARTTAFAYADLTASGKSSVAITDPLGAVTSMVYDRLGRLETTTRGVGVSGMNYTTTMLYDSSDRVSTVVDPLNGRTTYGYDGLHRLVTAEDQSKATTTYVYATAGDAGPTTVVDPLGNRVTFTYDALGRLTQAQQPTIGSTTHITSYGYDLADRLVTLTNPRGYTGTFAYDALSRLVSKTDALDHAVTYGYDKLDRLITVMDPLGNVVTHTYDALSRLTRTDAPEGVFSTFAYDAADRRLRVTDALNNASTYAYDLLGRMTGFTDARGYRTTFEYNAADQITKLVDPLNNQTTYAYDVLGRTTRRTSARDYATTYAYDGLDRLTSSTDPNGLRRDFVYQDADRRRLEKRYEANNTLIETLTFTYDAAGNLTGAANAAGAYTLSYDALNRPHVVQEPYGLSLTFGYDAAGNRTSVQDNKNGLVSSSYDAANRLTRRELSTSGTARLAIDYAYTEADQLLTLTRRDGSNTQVGLTTYAYDQAGRTTLIKHQNGAGSYFQTLTYSYDAANRMTAVVRNSTTTSYAYDAAAQLTQDGARTFAYDKAGNRTGHTVDTGNLVTDSGSGSTQWEYQYDKAGQRSAYYSTTPSMTGAYVAGYDAAGRLTSVEHTKFFAGGDFGDSLMSGEGGEAQANGGGGDPPLYVTWESRVDYTYDAFGNRIRRVEQVATDGVPSTVSDVKYGIDMWEVTQDFWGERHDPVGNELANVWADLSASNTLTTRRVYSPGLDQLSARLSSSNVAAWYVADVQGSVIGLQNGSGTVTGTYTYEAYGKLASGTLSDRYGYTGREYDAYTQGYHYRDRHYDPLLGRFWQEDPIELAGGDYNFYRYVRNNPTNLTDPSGLITIYFDGTGQDANSTSIINRMHAATKGETHIIRFPDVIQESVNKEVNTAYDKIVAAAKKNKDEPVNIVGWSRGSVAAILLSKKLEAEGIKVNYLGIIDPCANGISRKNVVEMYPNAAEEIKKRPRLLGDLPNREATIPDNVQSGKVLYTPPRADGPYSSYADMYMDKVDRVKLKTPDNKAISISKYPEIGHAQGGFDNKVQYDLWKHASDAGVPLGQMPADLKPPPSTKKFWSDP